MAFTPEVDTGSSGASQGPWIYWSSNGSAMKGLPHSSWVLRGKDAHGNKTEAPVSAFQTGCVVDLDSLKLGWEKDGAKGQAPERKWNPTLAVFPPRPDESKKASGAFAWSKALSVRCAIGGGQAATWEQGAWAAYESFARVLNKIKAEWVANSQNGLLLPLVQQTGVERVDLPSGAANVPILDVIKWVPRPDCLKADAPAIATGPAPAPQQAATVTPAAPPPAAASVPEDAQF